MILKRILRLFFVVFIVGGFSITGLLIHFSIKDMTKRRRRYVKSMSFWSGLALKIFNIKVTYKNMPDKNKSYLIVANHQGYLDIFYMVCAIPSLFVTSVEMRETPGLGLVTEMGGCLYVERRSRENILKEIKEIENVLAQGFNVVIYPEGTSTNGEKILPFKKSLLTACTSVEANILPVVMNYKKINGEPMSKKYTDWVCWYGDMTFIESIWKATQMESCEVEIEFLEEVHVSVDSDRRKIAALAQSQIEQKYVPIVS